MFDYENAAMTARPSGALRAGSQLEGSDLDMIAGRLRAMEDILGAACARVEQFLGRCGRAGPPSGGADTVTKPVEVGHIGSINAALDDLNRRVEFIAQASERLSRIG